jgi:molybdate transport system substrate-binding protein
MICIVLSLLLAPLSALAADIGIGAGVGLKDVLNELCATYADRNPSVNITKSYVASGALAKQMDSGLRVDVVLVANQQWMDYLKEKKHVDTASVGIFAYNSLVFVGAHKGIVHGMRDLAGLNRIALGSPRIVPAGDYALHAIRKAGMEKALESKLVMARDVRDCLMYAERGEVDGAFVYRTDSLKAHTAQVLFTVPQDLYPRVVYPMAMTTSGAGQPETVKFFAFLRSAEATRVLRKHGFEVR